MIPFSSLWNSYDFYGSLGSLDFAKPYLCPYWEHLQDLPAAQQKSVKVQPTSTRYTFQAYHCVGCCCCCIDFDTDHHATVSDLETNAQNTEWTPMGAVKEHIHWMNRSHRVRRWLRWQSCYKPNTPRPVAIASCCESFSVERLDRLRWSLTLWLLPLVTTRLDLPGRSVLCHCFCWFTDIIIEPANMLCSRREVSHNCYICD